MPFPLVFDEIANSKLGHDENVCFEGVPDTLSVDLQLA